MSNHGTTSRYRAITMAVATVLALICMGMAATQARADFGIAEFGGAALDSGGATYAQAGGHPYAIKTSIRLNHVGPVPDGGQARDALVSAPRGLVGDPTAVPTCTATEMYSRRCPGDSQVGTIDLLVADPPTCAIVFCRLPLYNLVPPPGMPAMFGVLEPAITGTPILLRTEVRGGDLGIDVGSTDIPQALSLTGIDVTLWGVPADPTHDPERICAGQVSGCSFNGEVEPFLTLPSNCAAGAVPTVVRADSWDKPGVFATAQFDHDLNGNPTAVQACGAVPFEPKLTAQPSTAAADSPTGLDVRLTVPQDSGSNGIASAHLKRAEVILPEGMAVNPSAAGGLSACSPAEIGLGNDAPARCPDSSKLGTVEVETPLLKERLEGAVYLAQQGSNPFNSLLALYLVVSSDERGVTVKLAGKVSPDSATGRLTATFDENPQLPFNSLTMHLKSGSRAPLLMPPTCGTYTTVAKLSPWSAADPEHPVPQEIVVSASSFQVTSGPGGGPCPNGRPEPKFAAGVANPVGGASSPFQLALSRADGSQRFRSLDVEMPQGLLGKLAGIPYCADSALASFPSPALAGTGAAELAAPKCPAASQVGTATVGAGAGSNPFYVATGRVYLAGPYRGDPLSLVIVTPALAGPFDLGTVAVRSPIHVDPTSAQISVKSDPIPAILEGIPLDLRDIRVAIDRPDFIQNPSSCDPTSVDATVHGQEGGTANVSDRFQVASCERLSFKPNLKLSVKGATHRNAHPAFKAVLTMPKADGANIEKAQVTLPKTELLENAHIRTICTRVQYAAGAGGGSQCPPASIYGKAKAWSPLLDKPLEGPVYLRSSSHQLPDLVASLDGQIHIDLVGRIDAVNARIRNTFEGVPDAPVSRFVLEMQGGKKGLLANNTELCKTTPRAAVRFDGQNGKLADSNPVMRADCGGKKRKR